MNGRNGTRSRAETIMRETIEFLIDLPIAERDVLSAADVERFTRANPAPRFDGSQNQLTETCTVDMLSVEATAACAAGSGSCGVCLLNFAHGYNCGGGFEHAGGSQEEDIFRKTSCFLSLWPHRRADDGAGVLARGQWIGDFDDVLPRKEPFYPHTECGAVYSPTVVAVRQPPAGNRVAPEQDLFPAEMIGQLPRFGLITAAAQNVRREGAFDRELLREKLRTVLWLAAHHGNHTIILGAFGSGYVRGLARISMFDTLTVPRAIYTQQWRRD